MKPQVSMRQALEDEQLLGSVLVGDSWRLWRIMLIAAMGEELTRSERRLFRQVTGRRREPLKRVEEFIAIAGRRGGKSRAVAVLAGYIAGLCDHSDVLAPGETGLVLCLSAGERGARIELDYIEAALRSGSVLSQLVVGRTSDTITLSNGVAIETRPASFRRLRGVTLLCAIASEIAFWLDGETSSNPAEEVLRAVRPSMLTTRGLLAMISSPYGQSGPLWQSYRTDFGAQGDPAILVCQGSSRQFNETLPQKVIDRAYEKDHAAASAEYGGEFRSDLEEFVSRAAVQGCISPGVFERAPVPGVQYFGFVDMSGGRYDSSACGISHREGDKAILDAVRERKAPHSPDAAVRDFAALLRSYRILRVGGDKYAGEWPRERFRMLGIDYIPSDRSTSDLYTDLLPIINSGKADLVDSPRLVNQLCGLERHTGRSGKSLITHQPNAHDDVAAVAAGAVQLALVRRQHEPRIAAPVFVRLDREAGSGAVHIMS